MLASFYYHVGSDANLGLALLYVLGLLAFWLVVPGLIGATIGALAVRGKGGGVHAVTAGLGAGASLSFTSFSLFWMFAAQSASKARVIALFVATPLCELAVAGYVAFQIRKKRTTGGKSGKKKDSPPPQDL